MKLTTFQIISSKNPLKCSLSYYTLVSEADAQILLDKPSKEAISAITAKYGDPAEAAKVPDNTKGTGQTKSDE